MLDKGADGEADGEAAVEVGFVQHESDPSCSSPQHPEVSGQLENLFR